MLIRSIIDRLRRPGIANSSVGGFAIALAQWWTYRTNNYTFPVPFRNKARYLLSTVDPKYTWIESGTYLGRMSKVLSRSGYQVITIEPEPALAKAAEHYFRDDSRVTVLFGTSQQQLSEAITLADSEYLAFWLDGHDSGGITYGGAGSIPLWDELEIIGKTVESLKGVVVHIDDFHTCCTAKELRNQYPTADSIVRWAYAHRLEVAIHNDIFTARTELA